MEPGFIGLTRGVIGLLLGWMLGVALHQAIAWYLSHRSLSMNLILVPASRQSDAISFDEPFSGFSIGIRWPASLLVFRRREESRCVRCLCSSVEEFLECCELSAGLGRLAAHRLPVVPVSE